MGFITKTVAVDEQPKKSMGGFSVLPDYSLEQPVFETEDVVMLVIVGGTGWHEEKNQKAALLVDAAIKKNIPVAAICDGVTFLAKHGYLDKVRHTGNTLAYIKHKAPGYKGQDLFEERQAVSDGNFITANGTGHLELAREILAKLGVVPDVDHVRDILENLQISLDDRLAGWYAIWKRGMYPD